MIVCLNSYEVPAAHGDAFVAAFGSVVDLLKTKPGFICARLHKATDGSGKFMTYAQWESLEDQKQAGTDAKVVPMMKQVLAIARPKAEWYEMVLERQGG